jgi:hypothetical protein
VAGLRNVFQIVNEVAHGIVGVPGRVGEADHVGQSIIAEKSRQTAFVAAIRLV